MKQEFHIIVIYTLRSTQPKCIMFHISDRIKLYVSPHMDPDINRYFLQNKVQFDIRFYFCHRGAENIHTMQKSMFAVMCDEEQDYDYVIKVEDESTKNHKETDQPILNNFMPENKTEKMCPFRSFKMYMKHLHPDNTYMWQTPNPNIKNESCDVWYTLGHIGKNTLANFMTKLSKNADLSKIYKKPQHQSHQTFDFITMQIQ